MAWTNPYANKTNSEYQGYYDTAFAPTSTMTSGNDWFDPTSALYKGQGADAYNTMYDTVAKRFLAAAGDEIADQQTRIAFGKNLASQRDVQLAKNVAGGSTAGTGSVRDALGDAGGDWLRSGRFGGGVDAGSTYGKIAANLADPNASQQYKDLANNGYTRGALSTLFNSQYSGPYRGLYNQAMTDAELAAAGADPHTGYYGTLNNNALFSPFRNGQASAFLPPAPEAPQGVVAPVVPPPAPPAPQPNPQPNPGLIAPNGTGSITPPAAPGSSQYSDPFLTNGNPDGQRMARIAQLYRDNNGWEPDSADLKYWNNYSLANGPEATEARMKDNVVTRAINFYKQAKANYQDVGSVLPPKVNGSTDVAGATNFYYWLTGYEPNRLAITEGKDEWVKNFLALKAAGGM